jgi:hypothetical protein
VHIEVVAGIDALTVLVGDLLAADEANHTMLLSALQGAQRGVACWRVHRRRARR